MNFEQTPTAKNQTLTELQRSRMSLEEFHDLRNDEVIQRILIEGTTDEQEKLRVFHKISPENFGLLRHSARLRHQVVTECEAAGAKRKVANPAFTDIERQLDKDSKFKDANSGVYLEYIEPQVRSAVVALSQKGYSTFESGFYGDNRQRIGFNGEQLADYQPSPELQDWLRQKDVNISVTPSNIDFTCKEKLTLAELKEVWNRIIADIPPAKG